LLRIAQVHDALERFNLWSEIEVDAISGESHNVVSLREVAQRSPEASHGNAASRSHVNVWAIAATVCLCAILGAWLALGARGQVIETDLAERRQVMLEDGTVVHLEPETRLRVKFQDRLRSVSLERGRALFRVTKDVQRPFLVDADHTSVRAVGTAFGVENGTRGVVVTVAEGKVAVGRTKGAGASHFVIQHENPPAGSNKENSGTRSSDAKTPDAEIFLTAGQQVTIQSSGSADRVRAVDTARALAWAEGQLVFENETLADVVAEFNRYNRTQLHISDSRLAARRVSGVFEATDTETLLAFIRQGGSEIHILRTDDGIVIDATEQ
jgi:ferric-dicitrate binding protein FerR (iron transport regulator)